MAYGTHASSYVSCSCVYIGSKKSVKVAMEKDLAQKKKKKKKKEEEIHW